MFIRTKTHLARMADQRQNLTALLDSAEADLTGAYNRNKDLQTEVNNLRAKNVQLENQLAIATKGGHRLAEANKKAKKEPKV